MCLLKQIITHKVLSTFIVYIHKQGDFVKLFGQIRTSIDDNGREHSNVRILSSKLLKAKEQMKGQEEKKESVLGAIKKYQAEDKEKPKEKKEASKEAER